MSSRPKKKYLLERNRNKRLIRKRELTRKGNKYVVNYKYSPKEKFSKLPVGVLRPLNFKDTNKSTNTRDPRFNPMSGHLNEGLFIESYSFVKDILKDKISEYK